MPTLSARLHATLMALLVLVPLFAARGADGQARPGEAARPRFALAEERLQPAAAQQTGDGRFQLEARLLAGDARAVAGSGYTLRAKLADAGAAACDAAGIFSDGFE